MAIETIEVNPQWRAEVNQRKAKKRPIFTLDNPNYRSTSRQIARIEAEIKTAEHNQGSTTDFTKFLAELNQLLLTQGISFGQKQKVESLINQVNLMRGN